MCYFVQNQVVFLELLTEVEDVQNSAIHFALLDHGLSFRSEVQKALSHFDAVEILFDYLVHFLLEVIYTKETCRECVLTVLVLKLQNIYLKLLREVAVAL